MAVHVGDLICSMCFYKLHNEVECELQKLLNYI